MKKKLITFAAIAVTAASLGSCAGRAARRANPELSARAAMEAVVDTTKITIDTKHIDSVMLLLAGEGRGEAVMAKADYAGFADFLSTAVYDTLWNDKGIMVNMIAPDYTAIIAYKGTPADDSDWLMVWKESGRAKFRQKWFFVAEDQREGLYSLLEKYRAGKDIEMSVYPERNGGAPQALELTVKNNTAGTIQFGANYSIERLAEGEWVEVDLGNFAVIAIMYGVRPGDSGKYSINLFTETVTYPEGDYRVVKNINVGGEEVRPYYAYFRIIEPR